MSISRGPWKRHTLVGTPEAARTLRRARPHDAIIVVTRIVMPPDDPALGLDVPVPF